MFFKEIRIAVPCFAVFIISGIFSEVVAGGSDCGEGCYSNFTYLPDSSSLQVNFHDTSYTFWCRTVTQWNWDFGDGNASNVKNPVHTYSNPGVYTVCLTVNNYIKTCKTVTVGFNELSSNPPYNLCKGQPITYTLKFHNNNSDTVTNLRVVNRLTGPFDTSSLQILSSSHTYSYSFIGQDSLIFYFNNLYLPNGSDSSAFGQIEFSLTPQLSASQVNCQTYLYFDSAMEVSTIQKVNYILPFNPNFKASHQPSYNGTYFYYYDGDTISVCNNAPVSFYPVSSNYGCNEKYEWTVNGKIVSTAQSVYKSFDSTGIYTVSLKISNDYMTASSTSTFTIIIKQRLVPDFVNITASASFLCGGDSVLLSSSSLFRNNWYRVWYSKYYLDTLQTYQATNGGYYYTIVTDSNGCYVKSNTLLISDGNKGSYQSFSICPGQSVTVGNNTYTTAGTYKDTLTAANGCDSIVSIYIYFSTKYNTQYFSICPGQSVTVGSNTYSSTGIYKDTLITVNDCDSIVTTYISFLTKLSSQSISICLGQSITVGNHNYTTNGTYLDTLASANGCDSIVTTNLTVKSNSTFTQSPSICNGQSFTAGTHTYTNSGTYTDTLTASNGCDSIITTNLTVLSGNSFSQSFSICNGQSVTVSSSTYTVNGCDSIVTTNLIVNPNSSFSQNKTINNGDSIKVGNHIYTTSGTYIDTLIASNNCDSIVTTNLIVLTGIEIVGSGSKQLAVKINPNPFSTSAVVRITNAYEFANEKLELRIYNVLGMEVFKQPIRNPKSEILNPKLPSGIYLYKLTEDKKIIAVGKLVVSD